MTLDTRTLAQEIHSAYRSGSGIGTLPTARAASGHQTFDLNAAYLVESEFARLRAERGRVPAGRKIGYANEAMWHALKIDTLIWANMYDDTVHYATGGEATFSLTGLQSAGLHAPKIEPEIVVKLKRSPPADVSGAQAALENIEWVAIGFEIVDCPYPEWRFKPADFVATWGFHTALIAGGQRAVEPESIPVLADALASFNVRLVKNGTQVEEGSGKHCLGSPALCVAEVARAVPRQHGARPLESGELISTGSLTAAQRVAAGDIWRAEVDGLDVPDLEVRFT